MKDEQKITTGRLEGNTATLKRVLLASQPRKDLIAGGIFVSLIDVVATLAFPLLAMQLVDSLGSGSFTLRSLMSSPTAQALFLALVIGAIASGISAYMLSKAGMLIARQLKNELFKCVVHRPVGYFDETETGDFVSRFSNDTKNISGLVTQNLSGLFEGILVLIGSAILLLALDVKLTVMIFAVILGAFAIMAPVLIKTAKFTEEINDVNAVFSSTLTRVFGEIRLVKAYTAERAEKLRVKDQLDSVYRKGLRITKIEALISPVNGLALTFALLIIFGYGGMRVAAGTLTIGTMTAFILYIFNIVVPIIQFSVIFTQYQAAKGSSAVLSDMLEFSDSQIHGGDAINNKSSSAGSLKFENVTFSYGDADGDKPAEFNLDGISFPVGKRTALIGPSGSGKSTVLALVQRLYEPTSGRITFCGKDISQLNIKSWRDIIGVVPQDSNMFRGTILDNVSYGAENIDIRKAWEAVQAANCHDFLPSQDSLHREVGEGGILLSGGQRQRLAIARAFYRDPAILLLDEATSALDTSNETIILDALQRLMKGRTTISITHRVSSLTRYDKVVAIEAGNVSMDNIDEDWPGNEVIKEKSIEEGNTPC